MLIFFSLYSAEDGDGVLSKVVMEAIFRAWEGRGEAEIIAKRPRK